MALYGELGFAVVGRRPGYYAGPVEDAVLMRMERAFSRAESSLRG
jgi:ribosomal-protein-alanine N-acetyltransferase